MSENSIVADLRNTERDGYVALSRAIKPLAILIACITPILLASRHSRADDALLARAHQLVGNSDSARDWLGFAEMYRAAGQRDQFFAAVEKATKQAVKTKENISLVADIHEIACWRSMPVRQDRLPAFREYLTKLEIADKDRPWLSVFRLYAAFVNEDRDAMWLEAVPKSLPEFPYRVAEDAHHQLLVKLGFTKTAAGLQVIEARSYEPLYALRDLDRAMSFEWTNRTFLNKQKLLRNAYLGATKHVVERLFAQRLLSQPTEQAELFKQIRKVAYINDSNRLQAVLARMTDEEAWVTLVEPLLKSEVAVVEHPPEILDVAAKTPLSIKADAKQRETAGTVYDGNVRATLGRIVIACDRIVMLEGAAELGIVLRGSGSISIAGVRGFELVTADSLLFYSGNGRFTLAGDVRLRAVGRTVKYRYCELATNGWVENGRSLLNDFDDLVDVHKQLKLLDSIVKIYDDAELTPDVRYLLAMKLLLPHLSWKAASADVVNERHSRRRYDREFRMQTTGNGMVWAPSHGGEEWMRELVPDELKTALKQSVESVEKLGARPPKDGEEFEKRLKRHLAEDESPFYWQLKNNDHADVKRAMKLLESITPSGLKKRARRWLTELRRRNTQLTLDMLGEYSAKWKRRPVVLDIRNAENVTFRLYKVRQPSDLLAVCERIGEDFVYRDYGLQRREERLVEAIQKIREIRRYVRYLRESRYRLPDFQTRDLVVEWKAEVAKLESFRPRRELDDYDDAYRWNENDGEHFDDSCQQFHDRLYKTYQSGLHQLSSWRCNRVVDIPKEAVEKSGASATSPAA
ncbi:MAG: hypothetical protein IH991_20985 [Planctomycetes bacterium]|nr:hypothetical protein [Planctomycetota bacterium]